MDNNTASLFALMLNQGNYMHRRYKAANRSLLETFNSSLACEGSEDSSFSLRQHSVMRLNVLSFHIVFLFVFILLVLWVAALLHFFF